MPVKSARSAGDKLQSHALVQSQALTKAIALLCDKDGPGCSQATTQEGSLIATAKEDGMEAVVHVHIINPQPNYILLK
jgi:hypothetical protein